MRNHQNKRQWIIRKLLQLASYSVAYFYAICEPLYRHVGACHYKKCHFYHSRAGFVHNFRSIPARHFWETVIDIRERYPRARIGEITYQPTDRFAQSLHYALWSVCKQPPQYRKKIFHKKFSQLYPNISKMQKKSTFGRLYLSLRIARRKRPIEARLIFITVF